MYEGLNNATLMGHVSDHGDHVVIGCPDQCRPKNDGQVPRLHLVHTAVFNNMLQVKQQMLQCLVVVLR